MRYFFNTFYALFIAAVVLVGGLFLLSMMPVRTGVEAKIVQSGSMSPAIPVGALVFITSSEHYRAGDIITFGSRSGEAVPTTHRVLDVRTENGKTWYATKGDANEAADSREVAKSEVLGKVFLTAPYAGFILDFARQPLGFALLIGLPASLVIASELAAIVHELFAMKRGRRGGVVRLARFWRRSRTARAPRPSAAIPLRHTGFERRFPTDDVFVPVRVRRVPVAHYASAFSSATVVLCLAVLGPLSGAGGTLSYFRDTETSMNNSFTAGEWSEEPSITAFTALEEEPLADSGSLGADDSSEEEGPADEAEPEGVEREQTVGGEEASEGTVREDDEREGREEREERPEDGSLRPDRELADERGDVRMSGVSENEGMIEQNGEVEEGAPEESLVEEEGSAEVEEIQGSGEPEVQADILEADVSEEVETGI